MNEQRADSGNAFDRIDVLIREALSEADADLFDQLEEPSVPAMVSGAFRGRRRWETWGTTAIILLFMGAAAVCAWRMIVATSARSLVPWGIGLFVAWTSFVGSKLVSWMSLHRVALTREVKRLELQVALLATAMRERTPGGGPPVTPRG